MWRCPSRPARLSPRAWLCGVGVSASGRQGRRGRGRQVLERVRGHFRCGAASGLEVQVDGAVERGRCLADGMAGREDERPPNCIVQGPAPGAPHPPALQRRGKPGGGLWRAGLGKLIAWRAPPPGWPGAEYVRALRVPRPHTALHNLLPVAPEKIRAGAPAGFISGTPVLQRVAAVGHVEVGYLHHREQDVCTVLPA